MSWYLYPIAAGTGLALIMIVMQPLLASLVGRPVSHRVVLIARGIAAAGWLVGTAKAVSLPGEELFHISGATTALAGALFALGAGALAASVAPPAFGVAGLGLVRVFRALTRCSTELGLLCVAIAIGLTRPTLEVAIAVGAIAAGAFLTVNLLAALPRFRRVPIRRE